MIIILDKIINIEHYRDNHALKKQEKFNFDGDYTFAESMKRWILIIKNLHLEIETGIIEWSSVRDNIDMATKQILTLHKKKYSYYQNKSGSWVTYLPKEGVKAPKGKYVLKTTEQALKNEIINFYLAEEKKKEVPTFNTVYWNWRKIKDLDFGSGSSADRYDCDYRRFIEDSDLAKMPIDAINESTIRVFMLSAIKGISSESAKKLFGQIKNAIRYARIEKIITDNPTEFLTMRDFSKHCIITIKPTEEKQYTDEDVSKMLAFLKTEYAREPYYMPLYAIEMAIYTGMRVGELAGLKWEDILDDSIYINRSEKYDSNKKCYFIGATKNGKPRHFPLNDQIKNLLERIKRAYVETNSLCEWIFANNGCRINLRTLTSCNKNKWKQLGGKPKSGIHGYRHKLSSDLRTAGVSITIVSAILGHSEQTNEAYYNRNTATMTEIASLVTNVQLKLTA